MKTPLTYYGGKQRLAPLLCQLLPPHRTYVEPFCGGAALFFAKPTPQGCPAYREVLNDLDAALVNFYTMLRDAPDALQGALLLSPYSERDFRAAVASLGDTPLEQARRYYVRGAQSYSATKSSWGRRYVGPSPAIQWAQRVETLGGAAARLQGTTLHQGDALAMIDRYDAPDTLFYLDPPYANTDSSPYVNQYEDSDWARLVERLERIQGSFILSHYPAAREPANTVRLEKVIKCALDAQNLAADEEQEDRTEVMWCRYNDWKPPPQERSALACFGGNRYKAHGVAAAFTLDAGASTP